MAAKVENRIALALLFFKMDRLAIVIPTRSESSVTLIFLLASMTSMFMIMGMELNIFNTDSLLSFFYWRHPESRVHPRREGSRPG